MTRALHRRRSFAYARRAQRIHLRQAHPDGAVDCVCERRVWYVDKRKMSLHRKRGWMCSPKSRDTYCRPRVKRYVQRWGLVPRPWMITAAYRRRDAP
jgi:hypothetical protein